ncbi:MAG: SecDF P1 head subdomain-containing protein, partial [Thermoanaerobaculia bacterium]
MSKRVRWRVLIILVVVAGTVAGYVIKGYAHARKDWIGSGSPPFAQALKKGIKLGLDLRGGIHLVLQVNTADALKAERDDAIETLRNQAREQTFTLGDFEMPGPSTFAVNVTAQTDASKLDEAVKRYLPDWSVSAAGSKWAFQLREPARRVAEENAVAQAIETIRNRVDEFGVAEPLIAREGSNRILVQLPGVDDPKRVKDLIQNTAFLELKLVESGPSERAALLAATGGQVPPTLDMVEAKPEPGQRQELYYLVRKSAVITGRDLKNARPSQVGQFGQMGVTFFLTAGGAEKFAAATGANVGRLLAIILDNRVQSAPRINERISDQGIIQGSFTAEEANDLALVLRAGARPA